jgi:tetratricopeptide (TPR) repeat protein
MLDRLAAKIRRDLKERKATIDARAEKLADITTINLEAYQHYFMGEEYVNRQLFVEAIQEFEAALALDSTFGLAWYRLAYAEWWGSDAITVTNILQKAIHLIDRIPEKERYMVLAMRTALDEGLAAGIPVAQNMEKIYPDDKEMLFLIGDLAWHTRQDSLAVEYMEKVLTLDPEFQRALDHLAWAYGAMGQLENAKKMAQRLAAVTDSLEYHYAMWIAYRFAGQDDLSNQASRNIFALSSQTTNPRASSILTRMGGRLHRAQEYPEAERVFRQSLKIAQPGQARSFAGLGWSLYEQRRYAEAEEIFRQGLVIHSDRPVFLRGLGWSLDRQERYPESEIVFRQAFEMDPTNLDIIAGLQRSFIAQKKYDDAESIAREQLKLAESGSMSSIVDAETWLGSIKLLQGKYKEAEKLNARALALDSLGSTSNRRMGYIYAAQGRFNEAESRVRKAIAADSTDWRNTNLMAWILVAGELDIEGGMANALKTIERRTDGAITLTRRDPNLPLAEHSLGLAHLKRGRYQEAVEHLEQAAALVPDRQAIHDDLEQARKELGLQGGQN